MKFVVLCALVAFLAIYVDYTAGEAFVCQPGVRYIENECNGCFCTETKVLGCTLKACPGPRYAELRNCQVGSTYDKGCNKCYCEKDLGEICTNNKC